MFNPEYVNPRRRDLLKSLVAIGAISTGLSVSGRRASAASSNPDLPLQGAWRGDEHYDSQRKASLWRANLPDRYPDVIVHASSVDDLKAAIEFADRHDLQVVCRASGHNTAGAPLRNGGMMIYTGALNGVEIDADAKTAKVEPSVNMASLFTQVKKHGLDFPTADCTTVAIGGYVLGGGIGRNGNFLTGGPYCNSLVSADVLLANGELITADSQHHADIFWAIRGCGPAFFGVLTSLTLKLFDPPGAYLASEYIYTIDVLPRLIEFFDSRQPNQDPQVSISLSIYSDGSDPDQLFVRVNLSSFAGAGPDAAVKAKSRLQYYVDEGLAGEALNRSEFNTKDPSGYMFTRNPAMATHTDNAYVDDAMAFLELVDLYRARPKGVTVRMSLGHNAHKHAPYGDEVCFSIGAPHALSVYVDWDGSQYDAAAYEWADRFSELAKPYAKGHYLNQIDTGVYPEKVRQTFPQSKWARLMQIRKKYDPDGRFFTYVGHER